MLTEAQIETRVASMIDALDTAYLTTAMTRDYYDLRIKQIDGWAFWQLRTARQQDYPNDNG